MAKEKKKTEEDLISDAMRLLGKRNAGKKKTNIDHEAASERAKKAAQARWAKNKKDA